MNKPNIESHCEFMRNLWLSASEEIVGAIVQVRNDPRQYPALMNAALDVIISDDIVHQQWRPLWKTLRELYDKDRATLDISKLPGESQEKAGHLAAYVYDNIVDEFEERVEQLAVLHGRYTTAMRLTSTVEEMRFNPELTGLDAVFSLEHAAPEERTSIEEFEASRISQETEQRTGLPARLHIGEFYEGIYPGQTWGIAGPYKGGKTRWATNMVLNVMYQYEIEDRLIHWLLANPKYLDGTKADVMGVIRDDRMLSEWELFHMTVLDDIIEAARNHRDTQTPYRNRAVVVSQTEMSKSMMLSFVIAQMAIDLLIWATPIQEGIQKLHEKGATSTHIYGALTERLYPTPDDYSGYYFKPDRHAGEVLASKMNFTLAMKHHKDPINSQLGLRGVAIWVAKYLFATRFKNRLYIIGNDAKRGGAANYDFVKSQIRRMERAGASRPSMWFCDYLQNMFQEGRYDKMKLLEHFAHDLPAFTSQMQISTLAAIQMNSDSIDSLREAYDSMREGSRGGTNIGATFFRIYQSWGHNRVNENAQTKKDRIEFDPHHMYYRLQVSRDGRRDGYDREVQVNPESGRFLGPQFDYRVIQAHGDMVPIHTGTDYDAMPLY